MLLNVYAVWFFFFEVLLLLLCMYTLLKENYILPFMGQQPTYKYISLFFLCTYISHKIYIHNRKCQVEKKKY